MKWLEKICNVLENPKYKNIRDTYVSERNGKTVSACALGELLLQSPTKRNAFETNGDAVRRSLKNYYRVLEAIRSDVHIKINTWNYDKKSKGQIARLLKKEYGK